MILKYPSKPEKFAELIKFSKNIESRYTLMQHLQTLADKLDKLWRTEKDKTNLKYELKRVALDLAASYNQFVEDLDQYSNYIKVKRCQGSNSLRIARRLLRPLPVPTEVKIGTEDLNGTIKFNLELYRIYYENLINESKKITDSIIERRWQRDLLTFRCDADHEFGEIEKYKMLTETKFLKYIRSILKMP